MPYCSRCGVEVEDRADRCPLCAAPIQKFDEEGRVSTPGAPYPEGNLDKEPIEALSAGERIKMAWEIATVSFGIIALILAIIDILSSWRISWSYIPLMSMLFAWLCYSLPFFLRGHPWLIMASLAPSLLLYLFLLDIYDGAVNWFLNLGLPIAGNLFVAIALASLLSSIPKKKGINIVAFVLCGSTLLCIGIDLIIQLNFAGRFVIGWSVIVGLALLPVAGFLLYLHYRVTHKMNLRRFFHL
jgi:hypothetical protein